MCLLQEGSDYKEPSHDSLNSALEEDELEKLLVQNKLGCDLYMRKFLDNFDHVECFPSDGSRLVHLPPVRFPDRFIDVNDSRPPRHFVAIHVSQAKVQISLTFLVSLIRTFLYWIMCFCSTIVVISVC